MRTIAFIFLVFIFSACDVLNQIVTDTTGLNLASGIVGDLVQNFNKEGPISTTFDDAVNEVETLANFEPNESEFTPLDIQPKSPNGGYILSSGLYSMNARSFCLRGYTHGPSRGDGHLYAPLKGKKADFVQLILERYGESPHIAQQNIQVLLWAIIAGADMNSLGKKYADTLNELFTVQEMLEFQGKAWLNGMADEQIQKFRRLAFNNMSPKLKGLLEADNTIRNLVRQNQSFQEIERIAIIAGVAPPEDMIRHISKGRWSYHPNGYYIRFFPNGYPQTRIDVYVPFEEELAHNIPSLSNLSKEQLNYRKVKNVIFNPATMVATPANQSSQRIGVSSVPITPTPRYRTPETECHPDSIFDAGKPRYSKIVDGLDVRGSIAFIDMVEKALSILKKDAPECYNDYLTAKHPQANAVVKGIGIDCHYGHNTLDAFLYIRLSVSTQWHFNRFNTFPEIAAGTIIHEAIHVHQAYAYMNTIGNGSFENFLGYYNRNKNSFELAATKKQIAYLELALSKYPKESDAYISIKKELDWVKAYESKHQQ